MYLLVCQCGHRMKVPESYLGKSGTCVKCKRRIHISDQNTRPFEAKKEADEATPRQKRLGERLLDAKMITDEQLTEALSMQKERGGKIGETLIAMGVFDVAEFAGFLARQPGVASIDLANYQIASDLLELVPRDFVIEHDVFPLDRLGNLLTVGMACPLDAETVRKLEEITGLRVKALLCSLPDIKASIDRYYAKAGSQREEADSAGGLETALKLENIVATIRRIESLPALPDTVQRVQQVMAEPDVSIDRVVEVVQSDPALAAKALSVANSAAYGFPQRVNTLKLSATLLGVHELYQLVLTSAVVDTLNGAGPPQDLQAFWSTSMACANVATALARHCRLPQGSGVSAAALLLDIGHMGLALSVPERYAKIDQTLSGPDLVAAEQEILGITHAEAGHELAAKWGLPIEIAEPIRFHHAFEFAEHTKRVTAVVSVAAAVVEMRRNGGLEEQAVSARCGKALAFLELDAKALMDLLATLDAQEAPSAEF